MIIAALDIGSNSIHLVVAETDHVKPFHVVASAKDVSGWGAVRPAISGSPLRRWAGRLIA